MFDRWDDHHDSGGDDINGQHNDDDLHGRHHVDIHANDDLDEHFKFYDDRAGGDHDLHHFNLYQFDYFDDDDVHCPEQLVFHYNDTEYVLVNRDHFDDLATFVDAYDRADHYGPVLVAVDVIDAARTLVDTARSARGDDASDEVKDG